MTHIVYNTKVNSITPAPSIGGSVFWNSEYMLSSYGGELGFLFLQRGIQICPYQPPAFDSNISELGTGNT